MICQSSFYRSGPDELSGAEGEYCHSREHCGGDAVGGVVDGEASCWGYAQAPGGFEVGVGCGFSTEGVVRGDDGGKKLA